MNQTRKRDTTVRAALLITGSTYFTYALSLLISALIARAIGPDDFGRYAYVVWMSGVLVMIANHGLNTTGIRFISECMGRDDEESAHRVHGWLRRGQWLSMAGVALVFVFTSQFFEPAGWSAGVVVFSCIALVGMFGKSLYLFDISMAKGFGRFGIEAVTTVAMSILNIIVVAILIASEASLMTFLWAFAFISAGHFVTSSILLRRASLVPIRGTLAPPLVVQIRRHLAWTIVLTGVAVLGNRSIETWLLNTLIGPAEVGYFAIAAALTRGGVDLLSSGLTTVLMPVMAHAFGSSGQRGVNNILSDSVRYFQFLGFLLAGSGTLLAPVVVALMYGDRYGAVVGVLQVMLAVGGLTLAEGAFGAVLSTTDNQRMRAGLAVFYVAISATMAVLFIPKYGLLGAILAHALSRVIGFAVAFVTISRVLGTRLPWREIGRLALSALIAATFSGSLLFLTQEWWAYLASSILFALIYIGGTIALRSWRATDVQQLANLTNRFPSLRGWLQPYITRWASRLAIAEEESRPPSL